MVEFNGRYRYTCSGFVTGFAYARGINVIQRYNVVIEVLHMGH